MLIDNHCERRVFFCHDIGAYVRAPPHRGITQEITLSEFFPKTTNRGGRMQSCAYEIHDKFLTGDFDLDQWIAAAAAFVYQTPTAPERNVQLDRYLALQTATDKEAILYEDDFMQFMIWNKKIYCIKPVRDKAFEALRNA